MPAFLSHIEEVFQMDGQMSTSIRGLKSKPLFPVIAKSFQTWGKAVSLPGYLPSYG